MNKITKDKYLEGEFEEMEGSVRNYNNVMKASLMAMLKSQTVVEKRLSRRLRSCFQSLHVHRVKDPG